MVIAVNLDMALQVILELSKSVGKALPEIAHQSKEHSRNQILPAKCEDTGHHVRLFAGNHLKSIIDKVNGC